MQTMYIGDFVDLVHRNARYPNVRFIANSSRSNAQAPRDTCTLLAGAWLPVIKTNEPTAPTVHEDHIGTWNVPVPFIPEYTVEDKKTGRVIARGWKALLGYLLEDNVIRPTHEVVNLLGDDWPHIRAQVGIGCY